MRGQAEKALTSKAKLYVACVCIAGAAATAHSVHALIVGRMPSEWLIFAALALVTGSFTSKTPALPARFSASGTFIFPLGLPFRPGTATISIAPGGITVMLVPSTH